MIRDDDANAIRGVAALQEALALIGMPGATDMAMAKIIVDNEMACRALVRFALDRVASEL